ncbi:HAMP domain-containing histidine kinase [Rhodobacter sp. HX-7-19]|uniref:histidine kinase n=1 Tax=Paragemmobacter kunshanensis TaxID=2583234 RepID=A0A6M1TRT6_9RHOB|nr:HAMP domain-containing histidine kinase [Rhodobacter kunshanensis]
MRRVSLRARLAIAGGIALIVTLFAAQVGLSTLFSRHAERAIAADLADVSDYLIAALEPGPDGQLGLSRQPPDPAYHRPYSGRYWQVSSADQDWSSRSLWDYSLPLPDAPPAGEDALLTLAGPDGTALLALDRTIISPGPSGDRILRITTALDRGRIDSARDAFTAEMRPWIVALGLLILASGALQIRIGLAPLATLRQRLAAISTGEQDRIGEDVPLELSPLAQQIDHLLDARSKEIDRSRRRAADLAHGLKTPLQALLGDAARLRERGHKIEAEGIETVAQAIRLQVDRELARATMAGGLPGANADVCRAVQGVVAVLQRTPAGARLRWELNADKDLVARIDTADLIEALGALIENAATHARSVVRLKAETRLGQIAVIIQDDGPGLPPDQIARLLQRGQRLDTTAGGNGLGLSIANEFADRSGGSLEIDAAPEGLRVTLLLPAATERSGQKSAP